MASLTLSKEHMMNKIKEAVSSSSNIAELLPILQCLSLPLIKQTINDNIKIAPKSMVSSIYYKCLSIEDILPSDVQQNILSFDGFYHSKSVCKRWKLLSEKNENVEMRKIYRSTIIPPTPSKTFIVHPKRRYLNAIEIDLGYERPRSMRKALRACNDGDRILIHDGVYANKNEFRIMKSVQIIGLGKHASFEYTQYSDPIMFDIDEDCRRKNIVFDNIFIGHKGSASSQFFEFSRCIDVAPRAKSNITIRNCRFQKVPAITNSSTSKVDISNCIFTDVLWAVLQEDVGELSIYRSLFKRSGKRSFDEDFGDEYVAIEEGIQWNAITIDECVGSKLHCVGNIFEDCEVHPVVKDTFDGEGVMYRALDEPDLYVLKDNVIKGNNRNNGQTFDANVIYEKN